MKPINLPICFPGKEIATGQNSGSKVWMSKQVGLIWKRGGDMNWSKRGGLTSLHGDVGHGKMQEGSCRSRPDPAQQKVEAERDRWVWETSRSRDEEQNLEGFCSQTRTKPLWDTGRNLARGAAGGHWRWQLECACQDFSASASGFYQERQTGVNAAKLILMTN